MEAAPSPQANVKPPDVGPLPFADLVVHRVMSGATCSFLIEPNGTEHDVRVDKGAGYVTLAKLPGTFGNAVAARLGLLAELTLSGPAVEFGRLRVATRTPGSESGAAPCDVIVVFRVLETGFSAEVFRTATMFGVPQVLAPPSPEPARAPLRYHLKRELGRGGMGVVYLGEHVVLQKDVAIKVLHLSATENPALAAQFVVEARAACRARHPGIVDVTDFGTLADGRPFIAMELVSGPTLSAVLEAEGPLAPARILTLTARIAEALHAASVRGVVHRDLTPANIFICDGDRPKIGDFGIAKLTDRGEPAQEALAASAVVVGTAGYMSPEQGLGEPVDARSDIYSLGCVMYRMVTGKVPFSGASLYAVLMKHMNDPPPPMESPHGPVPEGLTRIVLRALAKRPEERYQTAAELARDLTMAARGREVFGLEVPKP